MDLRHLTDRVLLKDTKALVKREREVTTAVLHYLREIERRRIYSEVLCSSLFEFCVKELGYSESEASRRISAARLLRELPDIENKIADGSLTLTNLYQANNLFKNECITDPQKKLEIIKKVENLTSRECEFELSKIAPKPLPREAIRVVNENFVTLQFNVRKETLKSWEEAKNLLGHRNFSQDQVLEHVLQLALETIKNQRFSLNTQRSTPARESTLRYIPAAVKKEVYKRDLGKCQKCGGMFKIEFDHLLPHALGGKATAENLRLLCFSCNQRKRIEASL